MFIIKPEMETAFRATVGQRVSKAMEVRYAFQKLDLLPEGYQIPEGRVKPWGTGHAVLSAAGAIDAPFAVINADDYYGITAFQAIFQFLSQARDQDGIGDYCMVGYLLKKYRDRTRQCLQRNLRQKRRWIFDPDHRTHEN